MSRDEGNNTAVSKVRWTDLVPQVLSGEERVVVPVPSADDDQPPFRHPRFNPRQLFIDHYQVVRRTLSSYRTPGFLLLAFKEGKELSGHTWLSAHPGQTRAAILGRHQKASLVLPSECRYAALRHLAALSGTDATGRTVLRLINLQTEIGFADPEGRQMEAMEVDGAAFFSVGGAALMILPTGPLFEWPHDAAQAYAQLPDTHHRQQSRPRTVEIGLCKQTEVPMGILRVEGSLGVRNLRVSAAALREGVVIGRDDQCVLGGTAADEGLSRVHLLLTYHSGRLMAIDTSSTNGTYWEDQRIHLMPVSEGISLDLGGVLELTWHVSN